LKPFTNQHLDKQRIAACFEASAATYAKSAQVQKEISVQLIDFLCRHEDIHFSSVLEIGCCTGILTEFLCDAVRIDTLYLNDLVDKFCLETGKFTEDKVGCIKNLPGDIETVALPENLDLVISSSTFQWIEDLAGLLRSIHQSLKSGGYVAFSLFGPGTMAEIAEITGNSLCYHSNDALTRMIGDGFDIVCNHTEKKRIYFETVMGVLRHIQETGVGGTRRQKWTKKNLREFESRYMTSFGSTKGVPVSYVSTFIIARKK